MDGLAASPASDVFLSKQGHEAEIQFTHFAAILSPLLCLVEFLAHTTLY